VFAHQVVDDLKKLLPDVRESSKALFENSITEIQNAHKFHMGEVQDLWELFQKTREDLGVAPLFMGAMAHNVRNPFKLCWYDFTCQRFTEAERDRELNLRVVRKLGFLSKELTKDVFMCLPFAPGRDDYWEPHSVEFVIAVGKTFSEVCEGMEESDSFEYGVVESAARKDGDRNITTFDLVERSANDEGAHKVDNIMLNVLNFALMLLNTRNIVTEPNYPSKQLNKARVKKDKPPIDVYHTLAINVPAKWKREKGEVSGQPSQGLYTMKFHTRKGHFAYYGPIYGRKLLFGTYEGRVWISPYTCGDPTRGNVIKEYKFKHTTSKGKRNRSSGIR